MSKLSAATPSNPTNLPSRYQIRKLSTEDLPWVLAIMLHTNIFCSTVWPLTYPNNKTERLYRCFKKGEYFARHQVESGHSFGVFDLEYKFKREESRTTGGKLYWDFKTLDLGEDELLEQMDFPLLGIALSYDQINPFDYPQMADFVGELPLFGTAYHVLEELDPRDESWRATGPNQVLMRNGTSTRRDGEGAKLMSNLARFVMRYAAEQGFRGIQIEAFDDRVDKVWSEPPPPFKAKRISSFNNWEYTEDEEVDGQVRKIYPFGASHQTISKIYVDLTHDAQ